jgi:hypothetical protein
MAPGERRRENDYWKDRWGLCVCARARERETGKCVCLRGTGMASYNLQPTVVLVPLGLREKRVCLFIFENGAAKLRHLYLVCDITKIKIIWRTKSSKTFLDYKSISTGKWTGRPIDDVAMSRRQTPITCFLI